MKNLRNYMMETYANFTPFQNLLYYFASFIGLAPFSMKNNGLHPAGFLRKSYAVILAALSSLWIFTVYTYNRPTAMHTKSVNDFVRITHLVLYAAYGSSSLLTFAFESKKIVGIWNRITAVRNELKNLGVDDDPGKSWKDNTKIIVTNSVVLLMRVIVYTAFLEFSLQLLQKPVTVAAFGFFHLDYSYIYKIFCAVIAYFIIMIQLDNSQPNRDA